MCSTDDLAQDRRDIIVTTKVFYGTSRKETHNTRGLSRKHVIEGTLKSLERLQLEYVDIVFAHCPDRTTPMEETVRAFNWLIENGKAFYWGTSAWSSLEIQQAFEVARRLNLIGPACEQPHYSMMHRQQFEVEYGTVFRHEGLGSTIWSPLEFGLLTGKYNSGIPEGSRYHTNKEAMVAAIELLETPEGKAKIEKVKKLTEIAESLGCSMANLALAWTIKNENVSTCIVSLLMLIWRGADEYPLSWARAR